MLRIIRLFFVFLAACVLLAVPRHTQALDKNKYSQIDVTPFEVADGVPFPPDYLATMTVELVGQLEAIKKFKRVARAGEGLDPALTTVRLSGKVTEFQAGNRAVRYFVGFGAGKTKIVAHVKVVDAGSGELLFEDDVDGKVVLGGAIKGESVGATRGLAKEVAKIAKQRLF